MRAAPPPASLPFVSLRNRPLTGDVLRFIPLPTVERYQVVPFALEGDVLKLAVVYPDRLKEGFSFSLDEIAKKVGKRVVLYRTDAESLRIATRSYQQYLHEKPAPTASVQVVGPTDTPASFHPASVTVPSRVHDTSAVPHAVTGLVPAPPAGTAKTAPPAAKAPAPPVNPTTPTGSVLPHPPQQNGSFTSKRPPAPPPPLFELGKSVAYAYLCRIPLAYAQKHRLVSVDYLPPNVYWFASDAKPNPELDEIIHFIEEKNEIRIHLMQVRRHDLDDLLDYYAAKVKEASAPRPVAGAGHPSSSVPTEPKPAPKPAAAPKSPLSEPKKQETVEVDGKSVKVAKGVLIPDVQATILSTEEEKPGIAGIFQRLTQNFGTKQPSNGNEEPATPAASSPTPPPPPVAPGVVAPAAAGTPPAAPATAPTPEAAKAAKTTTSGSPSASSTNEDDPDIGKLLERAVESLDELKEHLKKGFIPTIVAAVVSYAIHEKASDVHLEAFEDEVRIRYRIDGQLNEVVKLPPDMHAAIVSRIKILSHLRLDETRIPQDGRFDVRVNEKQIDLRVSIMPTVHGEKVVMRILEKSKGVDSLDALGLMGYGYLRLLKAINKPFGICLATGPTGSGKSTSLYAILGLIATSNVNVITLEDPVEYEMKGINQSQIRPKIGFSFAEGLRSVLRQDPNIIMVGEIRDSETANLATQAALTGHLVLSTLHTNDASGAIPRMTNMNIEPFLITSSLNVVLAQRLVRKICANCKTEVDIPHGVRDQIIQEIDRIRTISPKDAERVNSPYTFYQGAGCSVCKGKGYQGRVGIYEVLTMSDQIEELTLQHASGGAIFTQAQKEGMISMYQDGLLKVAAGITTLDEVMRETSNK